MKKNIKIIFAAAVLALSFDSIGEASDMKFGVVKEAKLMKNTEAIKKFQEDIKQYQTKFKKMILAHAQEIDKAAGVILAKKDTLSKDELNKKVKSLTERQKDISKRDQDLAKKIELALIPALDQMKKAVAEAVEKVAKAQGYDAIYNESSVAYFSDKFDVTDAVLKELNASLKKVKVELPKIK